MSLLFIVQFLMGLSILVASSRQTWAFSRDGALPFSTFFRPISQKFGYIPLRTIWGCAILAALLGLLTLIAPAAAQAVFSLAIAVSFQNNCHLFSTRFVNDASIGQQPRLGHPHLRARRLGPAQIQTRPLPHWRPLHPNRLDLRNLPHLRHHPLHVPCRRAQPHP